MNFKTLFDPLRAIGFRELRAVSPAVGGQTVNASFELLTGLPANGPLSGVIYQEYGRLFAKHIDALPAHLQKLGYITLALHNHYRKFWMRDIVKPKLSFYQFIAREDMAYRDPKIPVENVFIDDSFLFDAALRELRGRNQRKLFMFLTTAHTHGPFRDDGDGGAKDYSTRMQKTIKQLADFASAVLTQDSDAVIVVVGDHKPGMTEYFHEHGVFSQAGVSADDVGSPASVDQSVIGDMPVYMFSKDQALIDAVQLRAGGKPFYCLSSALGEQVMKVTLPTYSFGRASRNCEDFAAAGYRASAAKYPDWMYYFVLFDKEANNRLISAPVQ